MSDLSRRISAWWMAPALACAATLTIGAHSLAAQSGTGTEPGSQTTAPAEDATAPNTLFPPWSLQSTRDIDARFQPNLGMRVPMGYHEITGGPRLYRNFSSVAPDFIGGQTTRPWSLRASVAFLHVEDPRASAKLQEYRDLRNGASVGLDVHHRSGNGFFNLVGRQLGRKDQDVTLDLGMAGAVHGSLFYDEIVHTFAFDSKLLYAGAGTDTLTLPDRIQANLQNSATNAVLATKIAGYVTREAVSIDQSVTRQKIGGDLTLVATYPFVLKASFSNETRDGQRPYSGSFGFGDFVEIPWPVNVNTREFRLNGEWAKPESRVYASGTARVSDFINHVPSFTFDNPYRITDAGVVAGTFNGGPVQGRMTLEPSNQYYEGSGSLVVKRLPMRSTFNAVVSLGYMRQDEPLVPFSTNTSDILASPVKASFNATDSSGLPRLTAQTALNTQTVHLRWTANPAPRLHLTGQYRLNKLDNHEEPFTFFMFVREDQDIRRPETPNPNNTLAGGTFKTVPLAYAKHTATAEAGYDVSPASRLSVFYTFERMNREFREVAWMSDNKVKVAFDARARTWVDLKAWYERTQRKTDVYEFDQFNLAMGNPLGHPMLPWLEKFDEAPFRKNEAQMMATFTLNDAISVSSHALASGTTYDVTPLGPVSLTSQGLTAQTTLDNQFGVRWDRHYSYGADITYAPTPRVSVFAHAGLERMRTELAARQWNNAAASNPYLRETTPVSASNWTSIPFDRYVSSGFGFEASSPADRVHVKVHYSFSRSEGQQSYTSPVGTVGLLPGVVAQNGTVLTPVSANDVNAFVPAAFDNVDNVTWHTFTPELTCKLTHALAVSLGYTYESWKVNDYNYTGFSYTPFYTTGIALLMGSALPPSYHTNVVYLRAKVGL